ncbi:unnamed protein product [Paramecium pentaurelia]|uniref:Uncharacterized protein n=1 Tax=Paramecium pentaurelia TaxID=43138 RepID=A0A8S1TSX5_9CILI|nr:unnamed protein product [Paramecium pentaurelia]
MYLFLAPQKFKIWKEHKKNQRSKSNPYIFKSKIQIICLVLNSKEDLIIQGNRDQIINILAVDFQQKQIKYLYSLNQYTQWVSSLSLNNQENLLLTCGYSEKIIWKKGQENKWNFMTEFLDSNFNIYKYQTHNHPNKALLLKDDQFILFQVGKDILEQSYINKINQILLNIMRLSLILYPIQILNFINHLSLDQN